jgi:hypothetical protein
MISSLPIDVLDLMAAPDRGAGTGLITSTNLRGAGLTRSQLDTLLHHGLLVTLARGVYTSPKLFDSLDDWARLAVRTAALLTAGPPDAVAAGWSSVALHGLPHLGRAPAAPALIRRASPPRGSDRTARGWTRFASVPPEWTTAVSGFAAMHPAMTVIDLARRSARLPTLIVADAVARAFGGRETLRAALTAMRHWPGSARARWCVTHADADCETPLETVGRYAVLRAGLPRPLSNIWIGTHTPRFRLDHYWPSHRLALEGDGIFKYRLTERGESRSIDDILIDEKEREFGVRGLGVRIERYVWRGALLDPNSVANRCAAAMAEAPLRAHPQLNLWPAAEGFRLLGMQQSPQQLGSPRSWQTQVHAAIEKLRG